jgi:hypothetical protein
MTAYANAQGPYAQTIAAQFYFRNKDTNTGYYAPSATQWSYFKNRVTVDGDNIAGFTTRIAPGDTTLQYTVPRGHYEVYVRYSWWTGSHWTDTTNWIPTVNSYKWTYWFSDWYFHPNDCPVGLNG